MEPVSIYGIAAGGLFFLALLYRTSSYVSQWVQNRTLFYIFKYLIYPVFIRQSRFSSSVTRWQALAYLLYWSATAICNVIGVSTTQQAAQRAGTLATLHIVPLLFSNRGSLAADLLGMSLQTYNTIHKSVGLMAFLQSAIHTLILVNRKGIDLKDELQFYGFLVCLSH